MPMDLQRRAVLEAAIPTALAALCLTPSSAWAADRGVIVGGVPLTPDRAIAANVARSPMLGILATAIAATALQQLLDGKGPFTFFAPSDAAFEAMPPGSVEMLLRPENHPRLAKILTYHLVPGHLDSAALEARIKAGVGKAELETIEGDPLTVEMNGPRNILVSDTAHHAADIAIYDVTVSNGVIHVIDHVMLPR